MIGLPRHHESRFDMLGLIFRLASLVCFAIALIAGVLDLTRSIADKALVLTPLHTDWLQYSPDSLALLREFVTTNLHPYLWSPVIETVLSVPTWAIFALFAVIFAMAVRSRRRRWQENFSA